MSNNVVRMHIRCQGAVNLVYARIEPFGDIRYYECGTCREVDLEENDVMTLMRLAGQQVRFTALLNFMQSKTLTDELKSRIIEIATEPFSDEQQKLTDDYARQYFSFAGRQLTAEML